MGFVLRWRKLYFTIFFVALVLVGAAVVITNSENPLKMISKFMTAKKREKIVIINPGISIICSFDDGRLGSQMSTFSSLLAIEWIYGVRAFLTPLQMNVLRPFFHSKLFNQSVRELEESYPDWSQIKWNYSSPDIFSTDPTHWPPKKNGTFYDVGRFINHVNLYKKYLGKLRKMFKLDDIYIQEANLRLQKLVNNLTEESGNNMTFISIHGRRADYSEQLSYLYNLTYVDDGYFKKAIQYYRQRYNNILFYIVTEDGDWAKSKLENRSDNIYYMDILEKSIVDERPLTNEDKVGIDLSLLSLANHSIMSYGTFGMWGAHLAGGSMLMPKSHLQVDTAVFLQRGNLSYLEFI